MYITQFFEKIKTVYEVGVDEMGSRRSGEYQNMHPGVNLYPGANCAHEHGFRQISMSA